ncbi:methanethiol S-methyltransferase [Pseudomonas tritici]|uniref:methanethiol S-methyltransferase n=1 Tax=Pseudomonas tritici TaxID=2745518 RepID=UPI00387B75E4
MNLQKNSNSLPTRRIGLVYSTGCYLIFLVTFLYLIGFVGGVLVPKDINAGQLVDWPQAALINGLLVILFGVQHSVMARKSFKRGLAIFIPAAPERSTYVLLSSLVLTLLFWLWHPITHTVWSVEAAWSRALLTGLFWLGWGTVLLATLLISHFELFGLKQAIDRWRGTAQHAPVFRTPLLYKIVRHPLYLGFLIAFWATPDMTAGHLLFAVGLTIYLLVGTHFEEKDLVVLFGERYQRYQGEVSMIVPVPVPVPKRKARGCQ